MHFMPEDEGYEEKLWPDGYKEVIKSGIREVIASGLCAEDTIKNIYEQQYKHRFPAVERFRERITDMLVIGAEKGGDEAFDDIVTAHYGGYSDAEDYYRSVSTGPRLEEIDRATLVLGTDNDPFIPRESIAHWPHSEHVRVEIAEGAGHVGFIVAARAPRYFWAADRMIDFLHAIDSL